MSRTVSHIERVRRESARAAQHEHLRLRTPMDRQVDIFQIIEGAGIWLMFQPTRQLFGAYQRRGEAAGIILNSNHPSTLQRYTAAHEYGHHVLGHQESLDDQEDIEVFTPGLSDLEVAAQAFAADFLIPLQVVNHALRIMGLPIRQPTLAPVDAYKLSLHLGASYAATVSQLVALKKISVSAARSLRNQQPISIKEQIGRARPEDSRADVWILDESESGRELTPRVNDEVHVLLREMPSTGYVWRVQQPASEASNHSMSANLIIVRDIFEEPPESHLYGTCGNRRFVFKVTHPGPYTLRIEKQRPWQVDAKPVSVFEANISASERPTGQTDHGLSEHQKQLLTAA